jgi:hypothetical protein
LFSIIGFQIIVDKDNQREGKGFRRENIDGLFGVVVEYSKFLLLKFGNQISVPIFHCYGQDDQVGINPDFGLSLTLRTGRLRKRPGTEKSIPFRLRADERRPNNQNEQYAQCSQSVAALNGHDIWIV